MVVVAIVIMDLCVSVVNCRPMEFHAIHIVCSTLIMCHFEIQMKGYCPLPAIACQCMQDLQFIKFSFYNSDLRALPPTSYCLPVHARFPDYWIADWETNFISGLFYNLSFWWVYSCDWCELLQMEHIFVFTLTICVLIAMHCIVWCQLSTDICLLMCRFLV